MTSGRRKRHGQRSQGDPAQILLKLRVADAMLNAGKELAALLQARKLPNGHASTSK